MCEKDSCMCSSTVCGSHILTRYYSILFQCQTCPYANCISNIHYHQIHIQTAPIKCSGITYISYFSHHHRSSQTWWTCTQSINQSIHMQTSWCTQTNVYCDGYLSVYTYTHNNNNNNNNNNNHGSTALYGPGPPLSEVTWSAHLWQFGDQPTVQLNPDVTARAIWQSVRRLGWEMAWI
jgi:hypothetical protein